MQEERTTGDLDEISRLDLGRVGNDGSRHARSQLNT